MEMRSARWAIHSIICLHCAAAVVIGALAGLSGTWMDALVVTAIAYPVIGLALAGILAGLWGFPTGYEEVANAGLAAYLLGLGIYLVEVVQTWQDGGGDKT